MLLEQSEMQARNDAEKRDYTSKYEKDIKQLQDKLEVYVQQNNELQDIKRNFESENKEQRQKLDSLHYELDLVRNELKELRQANKGLDTTKYSQEKSLTEYMLKYQSLQRELEDKEQIISKVTTLLETTKEQKSQIEETLSAIKAKNAKMEDKLELSVQEINKGN